MHRTALIALLAALALILAACGGGGGSEGTAVDGDELPDDVAASVDGEQIAASEVDERVDAAMDAAADQLPEEGQQREQIETQLRTRTLQQVIVGMVLTDAADELGVPVEEGDLEDARSTFAEQAGGEEELQTAIDEAGMSDEQLDDDLRATAAFENIKEALAEESDDAASPEAEGASGEGADGEDAGDQQGENPGQGQDPDSPEALAQQFLTERLREVDVAVNPDYGQWDAQQGRVMPPEGAQTPQMPAPQQGGGQDGGGQQGGGQDGGGQQGGGQDGGGQQGGGQDGAGGS